MPALETQDVADLAARLGARARADRFTVAVAESLTGGLLSSSLARSEGAAEWFRGGVVAYVSQVKFDVLDVRPGPVVTEAAARQMAEGVARLLDADVALATTGVGGPDPEEDQEPGTVWLAARAVGHNAGADSTLTRLELFGGDPDAICLASCRSAIELALELTG
ncbi:MAG TPA: CinA family protein [Acidimicrobiales bacterium]|nr:CinA family protein [Acidimicrobiales bacterium]